MTGSETGAVAVERLAGFFLDRASFGFKCAAPEDAPMWDALMKQRAQEAYTTLRTLAAERDTLSEQLNAAREDAVTLAHRLTSAEGERDAANSACALYAADIGCVCAERDAAVAARVAAEGEVARLRAEKDAAVCILATRSMECAGCCGPSAKEHERPGYLDEARKDIEDAALAATAQGGDGRG